MTRHRDDVQIFGSSLDFWREEKLPGILSKSGEKLSATDYLDATSLEKVMKKDEHLVTKIFTRVSDELEAMGAVSKKAFWKAADHFLGINKEKKDISPPEKTSQSLREETRAEKILQERAQKDSHQEFHRVHRESPKIHRHDPHSASSVSSMRDRGFEHTKQSKLEEISRYIEDKLCEVKAYGGSHLGYHVRDELHDYLETLQHNKSLFQDLKDHNRELIKETKEFFKVQEQIHEHDRGMDLGM